ncbi:MAG TPA: alkaline phosphatase family protein [Acidimicrobiales bacterium]|nr:alkaline phosphatase family protein [Acidimicrobiales bacterium]
MLENESATSTFANPSADPYLASTLTSAGAYLPAFYAVGHASNDNYTAMVSGQPPNLFNQTDCVDYLNFVGLVVNGIDQGLGCVYPTSINTIGNQLTNAGLSWKGYMEDMGNVPSREAAACGHPGADAIDHTQDAVSGDGYASRHDPFVYFSSITGDKAYCDSHVVALGSPTGAMPASALPGETGLTTDLKSVVTTPNYSLITPNLCNDGHDFPCQNQPSGASALADIDSFLHTWVPMITSSPAFKQDGLLLITFDEGSDSDTAACCNEMPGLGVLPPGLTGPGGGVIGAVALSPFITPGTTSHVDYNHFSALASFESIFDLARLGEARNVPQVFGTDVFTNPTGACSASAAVPWEQC